MLSIRASLYQSERWSQRGREAVSSTSLPSNCLLLFNSFDSKRPKQTPQLRRGWSCIASQCMVGISLILVEVDDPLGPPPSSILLIIASFGWLGTCQLCTVRSFDSTWRLGSSSSLYCFSSHRTYIGSSVSGFLWDPISFLPNGGQLFAGMICPLPRKLLLLTVIDGLLIGKLLINKGLGLDCPSFWRRGQSRPIVMKLGAIL